MIIAKQDGAAKSSPVNIARSTLAPVVPNAGAAEHVAREPRQQLIVLVNLRQLRSVPPLSTGIADGAPPVGNLRTDEMRAMVVVLVARALTTTALRVPGRSDPDLVGHVSLAAGRYQPLACADIHEVFAMKLEQAVTAQHVRWLWFAGGLVRWVR
jgi:hypothetical protein